MAYFEVFRDTLALSQRDLMTESKFIQWGSISCSDGLELILEITIQWTWLKVFQEFSLKEYVQ